MQRWMVLFLVFALLITVACGLGFALAFSAKVEQLAFLVTPPLFMVGSFIGIASFKQS